MDDVVGRINLAYPLWTISQPDFDCGRFPLLPWSDGNKLVMVFLEKDKAEAFIAAKCAGHVAFALNTRDDFDRFLTRAAEQGAFYVAFDPTGSTCILKRTFDVLGDRKPGFA